MKKLSLFFALLLVLVSGFAISCSDDSGSKCDGNGQVVDPDGKCGCNAAEGYVMVNNGSCATGTGCDAYREKNDEDQGICVCNADRHWTGAANNCQCADGYVEKDNVCVAGQKDALKCDGTGQVKDSEDSCGCNAAEGYVKKVSDGSCIKDSICNAYKEVYQDSLSLCECNVARHWIGASGNCYCSDGFEEVDNVCKPKS